MLPNNALERTVDYRGPHPGCQQVVGWLSVVRRHFGSRRFVRHGSGYLIRLILIAGFTSIAFSVMSGPFDNLPTAVRGTSGRTYEIVGRIAEVHPDMSPVFYVVKFRVDDLDDLPSLRKMAEDIRPTFQAEAERAHFDWLALLAVKQTGIGTFAYERRYGFTFNRDTAGTWRDATNLKRPEGK